MSSSAYAGERVHDFRLDITPEASSSALDLDPAKVGASLIAVIAASRLLGHSWPGDTARHYLHPQTPEDRFVVDLLTRSTDELYEEWYAARPQSQEVA
jgi:hypothetical protein